jgi:hypothetical protein
MNILYSVMRIMLFTLPNESHGKGKEMEPWLSCLLLAISYDLILLLYINHSHFNSHFSPENGGSMLI